MSPALLILLGEELLQLSMSPLCSAHLTPPAVKLLKLLSWVPVQEIPLPTHQHLAHVLAQQEETLAQVVQRSCGYPSPGSAQGEAGQGFQQPGPVEAVPAHGKE